MPELDVPGGGPGTDPEMNECLRRLAMARMDYDDMRREVARRFPGERFLIVQYGDHHPIATRALLGLNNKLDAEDISYAVFCLKKKKKNNRCGRRRQLPRKISPRRNMSRPNSCDIA